MNVKLQRMDGPSKNVFITGQEDGIELDVNVKTSTMEPSEFVNVGGSAIELMCELLHQLIDEQKLTNTLLGEIGK